MLIYFDALCVSIYMSIYTGESRKSISSGLIEDPYTLIQSAHDKVQ